MKSKQQAAALWNAIQPLVVRTITPDFAEELTEKPVKTAIFRSFVMPGATPQEIIVLGEFLDQGEYAEIILQEVYC